MLFTRVIVCPFTTSTFCLVAYLWDHGAMVSPKKHFKHIGRYKVRLVRRPQTRTLHGKKLVEVLRTTHFPSRLTTLILMAHSRRCLICLGFAALLGPGTFGESLNTPQTLPRSDGPLSDALQCFSCV